MRKLLPVWLLDLSNKFNKNVLGWKWFAPTLFISISAIIYISTGIFLDDSSDYDLKSFLKDLNAISLAVVGGGAFTILIKFFQFNSVFKDELKEVIMNEEIHLMKSKKDFDNVFVKRLNEYSLLHVRRILKLMIIRIYPNNFPSLLGFKFNDILTNRLQKELSVGRENNYLQKELNIHYKILPYNDKFLRLEQTVFSDLYRIKGDIVLKRIYSNLILGDEFPDFELIEIEHFRFGGVDYTDKFETKENITGKDKLFKHLELQKKIKLNLGSAHCVKMSIKMSFLLSLESFLHWQYRFNVYTKGITVTVKYDKSLYLATILEFSKEVKLVGLEDDIIHKYNNKSIYLPDDNFMLAIHPIK